eukprot:14483388-Alexandrium_andersonii.AAC.1
MWRSTETSFEVSSSTAGRRTFEGHKHDRKYYGFFSGHDARMMPGTMPPSFRPCVVVSRAFASVTAAFVTMA